MSCERFFADRSQGRRAIRISGGAPVSLAPNKPKYKPRNIEKIKSKFTDQTSITECIECYRKAPNKPK